MISQAIHHLTRVIDIAVLIESKAPQAEAAHKLGLLYNMEGKEQNKKKSLGFLDEHFTMVRTKDETDSMKDQKKIDAARVNMGIVDANMKMETYKYLVLNDL